MRQHASRFVCYGVLALLLSAPARAQPEQIDLNIQNLLQERPTWCWAAASRQVILAIRGDAPQQCALVSMANGFQAPLCCTWPWPPPLAQACDRGGYMQEIQWLIAVNGGHPSSIAPPTDPMTLYQALKNRKIIVIFLRNTPFSGHFVVLRGMAWVNGVPVLFINDPMRHFTQPVPYMQLVGLWLPAIVVN